MRLDELKITGPVHWFKEVLGYLRDLREKKRLEREKEELTHLIDLVGKARTEEDCAKIVKLAAAAGVKLPRKGAQHEA